MERVVVLTGAAGGLGRAMTSGLAAAGHAVVMVDLHAPALEAASGEVRARHPGARVVPIVGDLADARSVERLAEAAEAAFGRVDALVNNAGLGPDSIRRDFMQRPIAFWEVDPGLIERFFAVNGLSPFLLACFLIEGMIARGF